VSQSPSVTSSAASTSAAGTAPTSSTPTHAQFVQQLDNLCARGNRSFRASDKAIDRAFAANDLPKAGTLLTKQLKAVDGFVAQIENISPPTSDQAAFERYLLLTQRIRGLEGRLVTALRESNADEVNRLFNLIQAAGNQRTNVAVDLGTTHCGS
jgi:hypothetical protein